MPICSYLIIPDAGAADDVVERLADLPGCDVTRAENRDVVILVTETPGLEEENDLRSRVEAMEGIQSLLLTFGEIDPDTDLADPLTVGGPAHGPLTVAAHGAGGLTEPEGTRALSER
jgi:nitrate reductase NapAB chaperone NapD